MAVLADLHHWGVHDVFSLVCDGLEKNGSRRFGAHCRCNSERVSVVC
jgi:hypothetical protein